MANSYIAKCVGRRFLELTKTADGKLLITVKWIDKTLCGLVFEPSEAQKLKAAIKDLVR